MARGPSTPRYGQQACKIDKTNVSGGTVSWSMTCAMPEIIQHAIWLYLRFTLSYRDVEELLAERGLDIV